MFEPRDMMICIGTFGLELKLLCCSFKHAHSLSKKRLVVGLQTICFVLTWKKKEQHHQGICGNLQETTICP